MRIVQVHSDKVHKISDMIEEMLHIGGKLMHCVSEMEEDYSEEHEGRYGSYGHKDEEEYPYHRKMRKY